MAALEQAQDEPNEADALQRLLHAVAGTATPGLQHGTMPIGISQGGFWSMVVPERGLEFFMFATWLPVIH